MRNSEQGRLIDETLKKIDTHTNSAKLDLAELKNQLKQRANVYINTYLYFNKYVREQESMGIEDEFAPLMELLRTSGLNSFQINTIHQKLVPLETMKKTFELQKKLNHLTQEHNQAFQFDDFVKENEIKELINVTSHLTLNQFQEDTNNLVKKIIVEDFPNPSQVVRDELLPKLTEEVERYAGNIIDKEIEKSSEEINSILDLSDTFALTDQDIKACNEVYASHKKVKRDTQELVDSIYNELSTKLPHLNEVKIIINDVGKRLLSQIAKIITNKIRSEYLRKK